MAAAVAEIRAEAVRGNLRAIRARLQPGTPLCVAVKADAYGHGLEAVLPVLAAAGVEQIAVAHLEEAFAARTLGWTRAILCLGAPLATGCERETRELARLAVAAGIECAIASLEEARCLAEQAAALHRPAPVQIKIDSGMGRMGLPLAKAAELVVEIAACPGIRLAGVYTHFASADEPDLTFTREQLDGFTQLLARLEASRVPVGHRHAANSAAIFRLPPAHLDMVRPGLAVYGYWSGPAAERPAGLQPIMRVVSRVVAVRSLPAGHTVGYGRTFTAARDSLIGVLPIGYADGYRRLLGNDAVVTLDAVHGQPRHQAPLVGRVSMDLISVDVTDVPDVRIGDPAVIIDNDPAAPNSVESLARKLNTIPYEVTCLIGQRVRRVRV